MIFLEMLTKLNLPVMVCLSFKGEKMKERAKIKPKISDDQKETQVAKFF